MFKHLLLGTLLVLGSVGSASASLLVLPGTVVPSGDYLSSNLATPGVVSLPAGKSQSLVGDQGFSVTGQFTFDASSTNPTFSYFVYEPITLGAGTYQTSSYLAATFTDTGTSGYVSDFEMTTQLFPDPGPSGTPVGFSNGGGPLPATGFGAGGLQPFCPLATCNNLLSGSSSGQFTIGAGTYYLEQTFAMSLSGVGPTDTITVTLTDPASGVGKTPEPGYWAVLGFGIVGLLVARRRFQRAAVRN